MAGCWIFLTSTTATNTATAGHLKWQSLKDDSARLARRVAYRHCLRDRPRVRHGDQLKARLEHVESRSRPQHLHAVFQHAKPFKTAEVAPRYREPSTTKLISSALEGRGRWGDSFLPEGPTRRTEARDRPVYDRDAAAESF